jgi:hypothetical protein
LAEIEYQAWFGRKENDVTMQNFLLNYYYQIPGDPDNLSSMPKYQNVPWEKFSKKASNNEVPWCAAFTSFVMRQAGINEQDGFEFSRRNLTFIVQAAHNRMYHSNDYAKMFWLFDINEHYAKLEVGDIVCMNRKRKNGNRSNHSFNELIRKYPQGTALEDVKDVSHTRIVTNVYFKDGKQFATLIGGNEQNTVSKIEVELVDGKINDSEGWYFGVIKLMECSKLF